ncbi:MAG TPA: aminotransferase class V-fold PLP-dependent enzyme [Fluviicola sp.]|nr:aminotransferase class V-fold PLP-dependent enzyme [Fluviicola sp.]
MENLRSQFLLNPEITFLNFGSFGACPKPVFEEYQRFQLEMERDPVYFIASKGIEYIRESREALAGYIGCEADDLVYTPNPTFAVNIVARNLDLKPGDEVLSTDLEYGALDRTWKFYCAEKGAKYVRQHISLPLVSKEQFIADFWKGYSDRTKVIFISQITSTTGLIFPVKEICAEAKKRGLLTIVDGAHVPGHIPLDLRELEADIYTGACHKWMMTPKGSSFLYVKKAFQEWMNPLVVSWGYDAAFPSSSQFLDYHQFNGTRDFSAYLTIPKALAFMKEHDWWSVAAACRKLSQSNIQRFCDLMETAPLAPVTDEFFGQMGSIPIKTDDPVALKNSLFHDYQVEIPVMPHNDAVYLRYSINAFNSQADLDKLYDVMTKLKHRNKLG